jgi:spore maturation protein CgeB
VKLAKTKTDNLLFSLAREHKSDLMLITAFKLLDAETIAGLKEILPHAQLVCWYSDMYDGVDPKIEPIARQCDWFLSSGGGDILQAYKKIGAKHCAFMPNPCDPDIHYSREVDARWHSDLLFTGKFCHGQGGQDPMREQLLKYLIEHKGLTVWGDMGKPAIKGNDYIDAICGTDIAISINAFNDVRLYHSDRLIHYLACGAFTLAKRVPDSDLLFENNKHLCYFDSQEQCLELINRFQADTAQRQKIAEAGMKHAHKMFNCAKLAGDILQLVTQGRCDEPWRDIV